MKLIALKPVGSSTGVIEAGREFRTDPVHGHELIKAGHAAAAEDLKWTGLQWPGAQVAILASGASLTAEQVQAVRDWRQADDARRVIAINTTFQLAPWADALYACDAAWWHVHYSQARSLFAGKLWTQDREALRHEGVQFIESVRAPGLSNRVGVIHQGQNSGYQAIGLAHHAGAVKLILLGFDMQGQHWHGQHPKPLTNTPAYLFPLWVSNFNALAVDLEMAGVEVVNCTPGTALTCFRRADLRAELKG